MSLTLTCPWCNEWAYEPLPYDKRVEDCFAGEREGLPHVWMVVTDPPDGAA